MKKDLSICGSSFALRFFGNQQEQIEPRLQFAQRSPERTFLLLLFAIERRPGDAPFHNFRIAAPGGTNFSPATVVEHNYEVHQRGAEKRYFLNRIAVEIQFSQVLINLVFGFFRKSLPVFSCHHEGAVLPDSLAIQERARDVRSQGIAGRYKQDVIDSFRTNGSGASTASR